VILVDSNLLIYAHDSGSPRFEAARKWLGEVLGGKEEIRFALVSLLSFVRIITNPVLFAQSMTPQEAIEIVTALIGRPGVEIAQPTDRHWEVLDRLTRSGRARGSLVMDAHLAALAIEHGATLCSTDRGFARFPKLRFTDPLEEDD
jgi:hypothetical protein